MLSHEEFQAQFATLNLRKISEPLFVNEDNDRYYFTADALAKLVELVGNDRGINVYIEVAALLSTGSGHDIIEAEIPTAHGLRLTTLLGEDIMRAVLYGS